MTRADKIYPLDKRIERQLQNVCRDTINGHVILRYYRARYSELSKATMLLYLIRLNQISRMLNKKFEDATIEDLEILLFDLERTLLAKSTKNRVRKILKGFYRWLKKYPKGRFPPEVEWITTWKSQLITVKAEDLLSYDECIKITECATNLRDKALLQCKLDAGCRIGEILTVKVGEIKFNDYGAILNSDGKTGEGALILTWSAKTLAMWLNIHPFRNDPESPLFVKLGCEVPKQLPYSGAYRAFKKMVKRSGQKKRIWLHMFKHVSCTWDSFRGMPESYRKYKHHWSPNSDMGRVYEHLSNSVTTKIQQWDYSGEKKDDTKENTALIVSCQRCNEENPRDSKYCNRCAYPLDDKMIAELVVPKKSNKQEDEILKKLNQVIKDPKKLEVLSSILNRI